MPSKATLTSTDTSCWMCSYAKRIGRSACAGCTPAPQPTQHLSKPINNKPQYHRRHVRASTLYGLASVCSVSQGVSHKFLNALSEIMQGDEIIAMKPDNPGVMLAYGDFIKKVPAIWLEPAENAAPTMDIITWKTLDTPTWEEDEVYVCLEKSSMPAHGRRKSCQECALGVWMNAGAQFMLGGLTEQEGKGLEWQLDGEWEEVIERKESRVKRVLGRFRKCLRRQKPRPVSVWD